MKTRKHEACIRALRDIAEAQSSADIRDPMLYDLDNLMKMGTSVFYTHLNSSFVGFKARHKLSLLTLEKFALENKKREEIAAKYKLNVKVATVKCGCCGKAHHGYTVKLDDKKVPYVICGEKDKRIDVMLEHIQPAVSGLKQLRAMLYSTIFYVEETHSEESAVKQLHELLLNPNPFRSANKHTA
jgi:hypothetical protein